MAVIQKSLEAIKLTDFLMFNYSTINRSQSPLNDDKSSDCQLQNYWTRPNVTFVSSARDIKESTVKVTIVSLYRNYLNHFEVSLKDS